MSNIFGVFNDMQNRKRALSLYLLFNKFQNLFFLYITSYTSLQLLSWVKNA